MAGRINELPKGSGVKWNSGWPFSEPPKAAKSKGDWTLAISITKDAMGLVAYYPTDERPPELAMPDGTWHGREVKFRPFHQVGSAEEAHKFCVTFCSRGYYPAKALEYQDGVMWAFNWAVPTLATVRMASQIAKKYFGNDYDGAWALGREFEAKIREAENALYETAGSSK
jgi:hypothetical protein